MERRRGTYDRFVRGSMRDVMERIRASEAERQSLVDEVDLSRVLCSRAVQLYEMAVLDGKDKDGKPVPEHVKAVATASLRDSLEFVGQMVERLARIQAASVGVVSPDQVEDLIEQVQLAAERSFSHLPLELRDFRDRLSRLTMQERTDEPSTVVVIG